MLLVSYSISRFVFRSEKEGGISGDSVGVLVEGCVYLAQGFTDPAVSR